MIGDEENIPRDDSQRVCLHCSLGACFPARADRCTGPWSSWHAKNCSRDGRRVGLPENIPRVSGPIGTQAASQNHCPMRHLAGLIYFQCTSSITANTGLSPPAGKHVSRCISFERLSYLA